jgi:hypothetical protein
VPAKRSTSAHQEKLIVAAPKDRIEQEHLSRTELGGTCGVAVLNRPSSRGGEHQGEAAMPAADRFVVPEQSLAERWQKRPIAIAVAAALGGVAFGALGVSLIGRAPPPTQEPRITAQPAEPDRTAAATTGSAPVAESLARSEPAAADAKSTSEQAAIGSENRDAGGENCGEQAWPYLTPCTPTSDSGTRQVRVISTDKLADPVESVAAAPRAKTEVAAPAPRTPSSSAPSGAAPSSTAPPAAAPVPAAASVAEPVATTPSATTAVRADTAPPPAVMPKPEVAAASTPSPRRDEIAPLANEAAKPAKRARKRQVRPTFTDAPETSERARPQRFTRGRIVERWTEREYDAPERNIPIFGGLFQNKRVVVQYGERGQEISRRETSSAGDADAPSARWR